MQRRNLLGFLFGTAVAPLIPVKRVTEHAPPPTVWQDISATSRMISGDDITTNTITADKIKASSIGIERIRLGRTRSGYGIEIYDAEGNLVISST